jgi:hypothetical protein
MGERRFASRVVSSAASIPFLSSLPRSRPATESVSLSEVLSALSHALDLTEGATVGHAMRSCRIGMRIAEGAGVGAAERSALYYAILLKDAGCSSNAGRMASLFGSKDQWVKPLHAIACRGAHAWCTCAEVERHHHRSGDGAW